MLIKRGESLPFSSFDIKSAANVLSDSVIASRMDEESEMLLTFKKQAEDMKKIAPKAKDFLYFTAIFMHAAEASLLDKEGNVKKHSDGKEIEASWEKQGDSVKWVCSDSSIMPYRNSNLDIFREEELKKAHKMWVGKPLCLDHKSNEIEKVRGIIVDTYYDEKHKRVVGLCALDKVNYPDLARQVETLTTTCVSMGTGVGRAICMTCGNVARTERDFCDHMRNRTCYGEINEDLNPIELSIVVNGADPKAKIKHIVAQTEAIAKYVDAKEAEKNGLMNPIEVFSQVQRILKETEELKDSLKSEAAESNAQIKKALDDISNKMVDIVQRLDKKENEESNMTTKKAYWQGTEEPTPGAVKYQKEDSDTIRNQQDKQMVVEPASMGPVDKLFPGDLEKKRSLQRAAALERAKAAVEKKGYFQGGGGVNEPTPGKTKYPAEDFMKVREKEDKQMVGEAPFPGVGKLDGLYDDDLEKKKLLQRADLKARFVKAADPKDSVWQVFAGDKMIFSATVNEISRGNVEGLLSTVATKQFGKDMLEKIRVEGFDKAARIFKGAQMPPMAPPPPAALPAEPAGQPDDLKDMGGDGDPKEQVKHLIDELGKLSANLSKSFEAMTNEPSNALDAVKPEDMGAELATMAKMRNEFKSRLMDGLKEMITEANEELTELRSTAELLGDDVRKVASADRRMLIDEVAGGSIEEARRVASECYSLLGSVAKYAKGTKQLLKRAQLEDMLSRHEVSPTADVVPVGNLMSNEERGKALEHGLPGKSQPVLDKTLQEATKGKDMGKADDCDMDDDKKSLFSEEELNKAKEHKLPGKSSPEFDKALQDASKSQETKEKAKEEDKHSATVTKNDGTKIEMSKDEVKDVMKAASFDLNTREGRAAYRAKLAEKSMQYSKILDVAHPGGGTTTKLDNKPASEDGAKMETGIERQKKMLDVAMAPPKVKAMAEKIQEAIKVGKIKSDELDSYVALGLDKDAVQYWKKLYGQADGGKEFANELTAQNVAKKAEEDRLAQQVKLARSLELANEMASKGMCNNTPKEIAKQAHLITGYTDVQFDHVKRLVDNTPAMQKQASFPQVGMMSEELVAAPKNEGDLGDLLNRALSGSVGRRGF